MTKRFVDDGYEAIDEQSFTDNLTKKTYWIDNGLDDIVELLNKLHDENEQLKRDLHTCHTFLSSKTMLENYNEELLKENEQLKLKIDGLEYVLKNIKRIDVEIDLNE